MENVGIIGKLHPLVKDVYIAINLDKLLKIEYQNIRKYQNSLYRKKI